jgi:hypothetical protein
VDQFASPTGKVERGERKGTASLRRGIKLNDRTR